MKILLPLLSCLVLFSTPLCWAQDPDDIPLIFFEGGLYVPATVTDAQAVEHPVFFAIDTAAVGTVVDATPSFGVWHYEDAEIAVLTPFGYQTAKSRLLMTGLKIGQHSFDQVESTVLHETVFEKRIRNPQGEEIPIFGILGVNVLFHQSLYLSITQGIFRWTESAPWREDRSLELSPMSGAWGIAFDFPGAQKKFFHLDTGTFRDFVPQEMLAAQMNAAPKDWVILHKPRYSLASGILTGGHPLDPTNTRSQRITGISTATSQSIGVESLYPWDFWAQIRTQWDATLFLKSADPLVVQRFRQSIDNNKVDQAFDRHTWGFLVWPKTGEIAWVFTWGDGTPLAAGVAMGDRVTSFDGLDWGPEAIQKYLNNSAGEFQMVKKAGEAYRLSIQKQTVSF